MQFLLRYLPMFIDGFVMTVILTTVGLSVGFIIGVLAAIGDVYGGKVLSAIINAYVEFFRGSPLVVQLFIFYYSIPTLLNTLIDPFTAGCLVFILNSGAYQKGYIKGAIEAIGVDQMLAARSLGMTKLQAIRHVILPQALRIVIPSWTNEFCSLTKSTSVAIVITIRELTTVGYIVSAQTFRPMEVYAFVGLIYFLWIYAVVKMMDMLYKRVRIPGFIAEE